MLFPLSIYPYFYLLVEKSVERWSLITFQKTLSFSATISFILDHKLSYTEASPIPSPPSICISYHPSSFLVLASLGRKLTALPRPRRISIAREVSRSPRSR